MAIQKKSKPSLTAGERLGRLGQTTASGRKRDEHSIDNLIVFGTSAGGHQALTEIFKDLPANLPAAVVILLHTPIDKPMAFKRNMWRFSRLPIVEVMHSERLRQGCIFVPPPGHSATFSRGRITAGTDDLPRPVTTINRTFASAAQAYGQRVIGVVLTGLLRDGTEGLRAIHEAGGLTMVQDPRAAEYPGMPSSAMEGLPVTFCLDLAEIGPALELLVRRTAQFETGVSVAVRALRDRAALLLRMTNQSKRNAGTCDFLQQELAMLQRDLRSINDLMKAPAGNDSRE